MWFKDAILYHVFVDRFAGVKPSADPKRPEYCGGNLKELKDKIPYFKKLGVNTIWLSPIMEGAAYHGYHVTDYFSVEPHFGTMHDFDLLVKEAHDSGLKIILDVVPNHVSIKHPFFVKARTNIKSRYRNWFYFKKNNDYLSFLQFKEIPKLNLDYEPCRDYIVSAMRFWLDRGVDGLRLDHLAGPSMDFWKYFAKQINTSHPHVVLIGEMWSSGWNLKHWSTLLGAKNKLGRLFVKQRNEKYIKDYVGIIDGCLDFTFNQIVRDYAQEKITHAQAYKKLQNHYRYFPKDFFLPTFLDNHDMDRILLVANQDREKLKELASWQFKIKQPPIIYYGTEVGMTQTKSFKLMDSYGDLLARQPMKWEDVGNEMFNFYKLLIAQKNRRERKDDGLPNPKVSISGQITS